MSNYQHKKGKIRHNALEALLHDPLFHQRVEKAEKGKGSYRRKEKHAGKAGWEAGDKMRENVLLSPAFCLSALA